MDIDCVTNEQFRDFVKATNYKTEAELYGYREFLTVYLMIVDFLLFNCASD